jgi:DNA repair protein RAD7
MRIAIPDKIRCGSCRKNFGQAKYSTKQLTDLRYHIKTTGAVTAVRCRTCTGAPIVEIECMMCHKTKGLEEFAKSQARKPDNAVRSAAPI